jgi:hypothetical protein
MASLVVEKLTTTNMVSIAPRQFPRASGDRPLFGGTAEGHMEIVCPRFPLRAWPSSRAPTLFAGVSEVILDDARRNNLKVLLT